MSKIPQIFTGSRICIICEGDEEYEYLEKLISLDVWSKEYLFQLEKMMLYYTKTQMTTVLVITGMKADITMVTASMPQELLIWQMGN